MKRLMGWAVLLLVLSVCVPSYGFFLIYNVTGPVKGVNDTAKATIPLKGYLVFSLDEITGDLEDANLIMYGKDSSNAKVYVVLNHSDSNVFLDVTSEPQGEFAVFNVIGSGDFDFEAVLVGQMKEKDIGLGIPMTVPVSVKGTMIVRHKMLFDASDDIAGTSTVSASLWLAETKIVNDNDWTQDEIVETGKDSVAGHRNSLIERLAAMHFEPATMPPP